MDSTSLNIYRKAYRYRLRTLPAATERSLRRWEGCCRKVWNLALDRQQQNHAAGEKYSSFAGMCRWLTEWRGSEEYGYLKEPPVHVLQNAIKALDTAFQRFFKKEGGYPPRSGLMPTHASARSVGILAPSFAEEDVKGVFQSCFDEA